MDASTSPMSMEVKWDEDTLAHMVDLLKREIPPPNAMSQQVPSNVPLGSDAYWALESTRDLLKRNVAYARWQFLKTLETVEKSKGWNSKDGGITRAVIVFMPGDLGRQRSREFRALFLSWIRMRQEQPKSIKTDLVVVTPEENLKRLSNLGCVAAVRNGTEENERCVISLYIPLLSRKVPEGVALDPLTEYKGYIDSMLCLAEYDGYQYDVVMRSDLDAFLMPGFATWIPPSRTTLVVGQGGYGHENAHAHLKYVNEVLGLDMKDGLVRLVGLGSTWFGDTGLMVASARLTIEVMRWMQTQEFNTFEKCCSGTLGWPHWHWPVLLLYGGHVALNHIGSSATVVVSSDTNGRMDFPSTSNDNIDHSIKEC